jgi:hypothetical protein
MLLPRVRTIHDEFFEMHVRNNHLDDLLECEDWAADGARQGEQAGMKPIISSHDIDRIVEDLTSMAGELKD